MSPQTSYDPVGVEKIGEVGGDDPVREVTVVIPAFNEGKHIASQLRSIKEVLDQSGWAYEIIVIDDGSDDETGVNARLEGVRVLRNLRNLGYGASLRRGFAEARYELVMIIDADGTYPSSAIPKLLERAEEGEMVVGARTGDVSEVPLIRRPAKWVLTRLASYLAGQKIPDLNSGLRLIRKELVMTYRHLLPSDFSFTTTITLAAVCNDHVVTYVPIDYHARLGESKIRSRHAYDFLILILRTVVFFNPLKVFIPFGLILAIIGLAKLAYDVTLGNVSESAVLCLLSALIVWSVGLLADQNVRIQKMTAQAQNAQAQRLP